MFRWNSDRALAAVTGLAARLAAVIVLLIIGFVILQSVPALQELGPARFFTDDGWYPTGEVAARGYNLAPMVVATVLCAVGALLLAAPLGLLVAVWLTEYAPAALGRPVEALVGLMAGVPSVVYGLWGLVTLVPLIAAWQPPGASLLSGILVLFLMVLPTVILATVAALRAVTPEWRMAAAALGMGPTGALWRVVVPAARGGIRGALVLALARAIGETMAVLMVTGNVVRMPDSLFDPVRTLTANIALELAYAVDLHRSALFVGGLLLAALVAALVLAAERPREARRHA